MRISHWMLGLATFTAVITAAIGEFWLTVLNAGMMLFWDYTIRKENAEVNEHKNKHE